MIRRRDASGGVRVDPARFVHDNGVGPERYFGEPGYDSEQVAEQAWRKVRREVWSQCRRLSVPAAATEYDGITCSSVDAVRSEMSFTAVPFDRGRIDRAIAADRASVAAFREEEPTAAVQIATFLDQLLTDLEVVRAAADIRERGGDGGWMVLGEPTRYTYGQIAGGGTNDGRG